MLEHGLAESLRDAVPRMREAARRPAGVAGVVEILTPWFATYPQPQRTETEWEAWWRSYALVCENFSTAALYGAMLAWAKRPDSEFLPKPGQLAALAKETPTAASRDATHAWSVLNAADDMLQHQRVLAAMEADGVKPEEQRRAIAELAAGFSQQTLGVRAEQRRVLQRGTRGAAQPDHALPNTAGVPPKGHAITREMMRVLGRAEPAPDHLTEAPEVGEPQFSEDAP